MRVACTHSAQPWQASQFRSPRPGEIWKLKQCLCIPAELSPTGQRHLWCSDKPHSYYVMVVKEPEVIEGEQTEWPVLSVMLLSAQTQFLSEVDLLLPGAISGLKFDLLLETWHVQLTLLGNLSHLVGNRLPRHLYDLVLTIGDCHLKLSSELPPASDLRSQGLQLGTATAQDSSIQSFHQQETAFSQHFSLLLPDHQRDADGIALTATLLNESLQWQQELIELAAEANLSTMPQDDRQPDPIPCVSFCSGPQVSPNGSE
jgi:hypothetical protein